MKETQRFCHVYLDALILDAEPVVLHRGGTSKYLKSVKDRRHESFSCHQWFEVDSPVFDYEILELSQRESWNNLIEHRVPNSNEYYRSEDFCDVISLYHKTEPISWSGNFYEFIDDYCLWVASGVWYHRQNYTNFRNAYKHEVCAAYFNYPAEQRNETSTTIFTGSLDKVSKIADFMNTLGTPSLRFVASPVITIPPYHSYGEVDKQVSILSSLLEWCSTGEYWIGGGAVVKHETGKCGCPKCAPFRKW